MEIDIETTEGQRAASAKMLELAGCTIRKVPIKGWLEFQPPEGGMYRLVMNLFAEPDAEDYSRESLHWLWVAFEVVSRTNSGRYLTLMRQFANPNTFNAPAHIRARAIWTAMETSDAND